MESGCNPKTNLITVETLTTLRIHTTRVNVAIVLSMINAGCEELNSQQRSSEIISLKEVMNIAVVSRSVFIGKHGLITTINFSHKLLDSHYFPMSYCIQSVTSSGLCPSPFEDACWDVERSYLKTELHLSQEFHHECLAIYFLIGIGVFIPKLHLIAENFEVLCENWAAWCKCRHRRASV